MPPVRTAIIGVSGFAATHYDDLLRQTARGAMQPVAATIINPAEEKAKVQHLRSLGCAICGSHRDMLDREAGRTDLCLVPTGIPLHAPMTIDAVRAGCHVLVEKPAAGCPADVDAMAAAAAAADRLVFVGFQRMYSPVTWALKARILDGAIGDVQAFKTIALLPRHDAYYARNAWAGRLRVGDACVFDSQFNNATAHYLMLMLFLAGPARGAAAAPREVDADLYRARADIESPDTVALRYRGAQHAPVYFYGSHCSRRNTGHLMVVRGSRGEIVWRSARGGERAILRRPGHPDEEHDVRYGPWLRDHMLATVCAAVRGEAVDGCPLSLAAAHTAAVKLAHDTAAVRPVDARFTSRGACDGKPYTVLDGSDEALTTCFEREVLLRDLALPWS